VDGGQYVGLRRGVGPDVDILFHGRPPGGEREVYNALTRVLNETSKKGIVSANYGDYSALAGTQEWVIVRPEGYPPGWDEDQPGALRVPRALKHLVPCFRQAVRAADRLAPAREPSSSSG